jgi:hypothetical protein
MADRMSTEEFALANMTRSMGRSEQTEQQRAMQRACDDATMRAIVGDHRTSVFGPSVGPAAKVVPADAGKVTTGTDGTKWGWVDPVPLTRKACSEMTKEEIAARDEEWRREFEARKQAEASKQVK